MPSQSVERELASAESKNSIPKKPIPQIVCNEADSRPSSSAMTFTINEEASLISEDTEIQAKKTGSHTKRRLKRLRLSSRKLRSTIVHYLATLCVVGLSVASVLGGLSIEYGLLTDYSVCDSGGNFQLNPEHSFWSPSRAFEITLGFGNFSFAVAKFVDVVWDVVTIL